jgi:translation initiation factor IF-2
MRVHELAKELGIPSKDFRDKLSALGIKTKSHMSSLDEDTVALIRAELGSPAAEAVATEEKPAETKPAEKAFRLCYETAAAGFCCSILLQVKNI